MTQSYSSWPLIAYPLSIRLTETVRATPTTHRPTSRSSSGLITHLKIYLYIYYMKAIKMYRLTKTLLNRILPLFLLVPGNLFSFYFTSGQLAGQLGLELIPTAATVRPLHCFPPMTSEAHIGNSDLLLLFWMSGCGIKSRSPRADDKKGLKYNHLAL